MGLEVAIAAAQPRLGRNLFWANSAVYLLGLMLKAKGVLTTFDGNLPLFVIYNAIGLGSLVAATVLTGMTWTKDPAVAKLKSFTAPWAHYWWRWTWREAGPVLLLGGLFVAGAAFYLYLPITSMTNPPLNWGYPRTWQGFIHAFTRGQYERTNPTASLGRFFDQVRLYIEGAVEEFNLVYLLIGLVPFLFFRRMQKRERAWLSGLTAIYLCLAVLLLILLNPNYDRQSKDQSRVFFAASHVIIAMAIGYGLTLFGGLLAMRYDLYRRWGLYASAGATGVALYAFVLLQSQLPIDKFTALYAVGLATAAVGIFLVARVRAPMKALLVLFALLPGHSILSHWSDNEQRGHLFGYWFGHDMFSPPFPGPDGQLTYDRELRERLLQDPEQGKLIYPEMARNAVLYGGTDPGRFNPTYMIFCESFIPRRCKLDTDPDFDRRDVYLITQNALADGTYLDYIRAHYNRSAQHDPPFFQDMLRHFQELCRSQRDRLRGTTNGLARLFNPLIAAARPLDDWLTAWGARVEARRRREGVYPPKEILTATPKELEQAFNDYMLDAQRRLQHDLQFPNEPKQIKPGEDVRIIDNRVQVSGQVAVMAINGLLTKVIFDKNPDHEFYVEESFPLDWMYPYLEPFGIIMKINRQPLPEITEAMVQRDHFFWSRYAERLCGDWITYDTTIPEICEFAERIYLRRDFTNFKGDPKFVRDDVAQKSFSKLRNSIAGLYAERVRLAKTDDERQRMFKEADFAFKQAYAFCPYNLEALYRYVNLLLNLNRIDDALRLVMTSLKFDEENQALWKLFSELGAFKQGGLTAAPPPSSLAQLEAQYRSNPTDPAISFQLASAYLAQRRTNDAVRLLEVLVVNPQADASTLLSVANAFAQLGQVGRLEATLQRVAKVMPDSPEVWYDLAAVQAVLQNPAESLKSVTKAIELSNARKAADPQAKDLIEAVRQDARFDLLRRLPEFQQLLRSN
jgi:thioredoxin-like negative regulator of GroEL